MKIFVTLLLSILFITTGFAQQTIYYKKKDGRYLNNPDSADYTQVITRADSTGLVLSVKDTWKNGKPKTDATMVKNGTVTAFEGDYTTYYETGIKKSRSTYKSGVKLGPSFEYYPNGKLYRVLNFPPNGERDSELMEKFFITANYDSLGKASVENGNGYYKGFDASFKYLNEWGNVKNSGKDGAWAGVDSARQLTFTETYKNGVLMSGTSLQKGQTYTYNGLRYKSPEFKGGEKAFNRFLSKNVVYPTLARMNNIQGRVILTFVIEKNGELTDIKIVRSVNPIIDDEALRVLKQSPAWVPGMANGAPVRVQYSVPINFALAKN